MTAARFLTSPCLPFCMRHKFVSDGVLVVVEQSVGSVAWHVFRGMVQVGSGITHLPLGKSQVHLSSALGSQSLVLLERAADNTGGDGQVTVVAVIQSNNQSSGLDVSSVVSEVGVSRRGQRCSPETSGFPGGDHCDGIEEWLGVKGV